jgi:hypothetical protein
MIFWGMIGAASSAAWPSKHGNLEAKSLLPDASIFWVFGESRGQSRPSRLNFEAGFDFPTNMRLCGAFRC